MNLKKVIPVVAALAVIAAGVSYAAIPSSNGVISACKDNKGILKVIDAEAGQTCNANQQLLTWNQQGQPGPQGSAGPQGPSGPQGPAGSALGFAWVSAEGDVLEHRSLNVGDANVTKPAGSHGIYCFHGLPVAPKVATVTPLMGSGAGSGSYHPTPEIGFAQGCDEIAGHNMNVLMIDQSTGFITRDKPFYVVFN